MSESTVLKSGMELKCLSQPNVWFRIREVAYLNAVPHVYFAKVRKNQDRDVNGVELQQGHMAWDDFKKVTKQELLKYEITKPATLGALISSDERIASAIRAFLNDERMQGPVRLALASTWQDRLEQRKLLAYLRELTVLGRVVFGAEVMDSSDVNKLLGIQDLDYMLGLSVATVVKLAGR